MSYYLAGLTGGIACGKTTAAHLFAACGITVIDADEIVGELTAADGEALPLLRAQLGDWVITAKGDYNRPVVRDKIFADAALRQQIEAILHPLVRQQMRARLQAASSPYALGVVPLLLEGGSDSGWTEYFQHIIVVECAEQTQITRVEKRDKRNDGAQIIAAQMVAEERCRHADTVIKNNGDLPALFSAVYRLHTQLLALAV